MGLSPRLKVNSQNYMKEIHVKIEQQQIQDVKEKIRKNGRED